MSRMQAAAGVTSFMPTSMTISEEALAQVFDCVRGYAGSEPGARIAGIYMEGPFFSEKRKGAQSSEHLRLPDAAMFRRLQAAAGGLIRVVALAPELPGSEAFIREVAGVSEGFARPFGCGHLKTAARAYAAGASHATHLFCAMPPMLHRAPGLVGATFDGDATRPSSSAMGCMSTRQSSGWPLRRSAYIGWCW